MKMHEFIDVVNVIASLMLLAAGSVALARSQHMHAAALFAYDVALIMTFQLVERVASRS